MSENKGKKGTWTRRAFMAAGGLIGTGLVVGVAGMSHVNRKIHEYSGRGMGEGASLNAWIRIAPDNMVTIAIPRAEMGQGVYTSLPMLVAEELEVDMESIKVIHPQPEAPYSNVFALSQSEPNAFEGYSTLQKLFAFMTIVMTGGSTSVPDGFTNLRLAGATAREMLKRAAAERWGVDLSRCEAKQGAVLNLDTNETVTYGELAEAASLIELAEMPELKAKKDWRILGKPVRRLDVEDKSTGKAEFGIDVRPDNVLYASVRHPSVVGGKIVAIENEEEVSQMPGVEKVVLTEYGAAVVADNTWRSKNAALALKLREDNKGNGSISTESVMQTLNGSLDKDASAVVEEEGDIDAILGANPDGMLESQYELPYLAHATMEPLNCTVLITDDAAELWVGHQGVSVVLNYVHDLTGIDKSNIMIHTAYLGGGFGRRSEVDNVNFATAIAMEMKGQPVMTVFTREEDMQNDFYRPAAVSRFKAMVEPNGDITAWENKIASQPVGYEALKRLAPGMPGSPNKDGASVEGAVHLPYVMGSKRITFDHLESPIPIGFWRSVGSSTNAFFTECFMDECAAAAQMDPLTFRRSKLDNHPRFVTVLDMLAEKSNWETPLEEGRFRGMALHKSFGSIVGEVAEITQIGEKEFSIDKFHCVIDCGTYISPDIIESQMAGGIIYGLTAALYGEINFKEGVVQEVNFPQYLMMLMANAPDVDVYIVENDEYPGGVGEPSTPPAAPALVNALYAATGERIRTLPLIKQGYRFS